MGKGEEMQDHYWIVEEWSMAQRWKLLSVHASRSDARRSQHVVHPDLHTRVRKFVAA